MSEPRRAQVAAAGVGVQAASTAALRPSCPFSRGAQEARACRRRPHCRQGDVRRERGARPVPQEATRVTFAHSLLAESWSHVTVAVREAKSVIVGGGSVPSSRDSALSKRKGRWPEGPLTV